MNRFFFALLNIQDKINKIISNPELIRFYFQVYIFSQLKKEQPHIYIVSYPKCGRTWLRIMLHRYLEDLGLSISNSNNIDILELQDGRKIKFEHDQGSWVPAPPRIKNLKYNKSKYVGKKIVFLVRDPRDVLVSSWYHLKFRENIYRKSLSDFIRDELLGVGKIVSFFNIWCDSKEVPDEFSMIYYEDLHADTKTSFRNLLFFLNIPVNEKSISKAVAACTFENMKAMEARGGLKEPWMKPGAKNLKNSMKIRKGKIGGFKEELSKEDVAYLNNYIFEELNKELPYGNN